jgi:eukaryotic-like serine/threonine-protein kinase
MSARPEGRLRMSSHSRRLKKRKMSPKDFSYLLGTDLFKAAPEEAQNRLLACMAPLTVRAGDRFIHQGEEADCLYLIEEGSCVVSLEKDGATTAVARRKAGDLIGEMAILTGENRTAHVEAETRMSLWRMSRVEFDELSRTYPSVRRFVTELVTKRVTDSKFAPHRTIGKYVITDTIDEGGLGILYKGVHESLNFPVAIKMLKHSMAMDTEFTKEFENEAHVIARLNHPNIVRVYDIEHLYRTIFIVMEYLSGQSLKDILERMRRLPFTRAMNLLIQVGKGLEYAHEQGIVHRDIKPDNIFISQGDQVKIVDFGLALPVGTGEGMDLVGTPYYMAPEQIDCEPVDERTDIYSLGITAFEISTGFMPFSGPDVGEILIAHQEKPLPDPRSLKPDLPAAFNDFIQKAAQKDPAKRHQTMGQVVADLKLLAERYVPSQDVDGNPSLENMVLHLSYHDVDRLELARVVEDFGEQLKKLGVELSVASFHRG